MRIQVNGKLIILMSIGYNRKRSTKRGFATNEAEEWEEVSLRSKLIIQ